MEREGEGGRCLGGRRCRRAEQAKSAPGVPVGGSPPPPAAGRSRRWGSRGGEPGRRAVTDRRHTGGGAGPLRPPAPSSAEVLAPFPLPLHPGRSQPLPWRISAYRREIRPLADLAGGEEDEVREQRIRPLAAASGRPVLDLHPGRGAGGRNTRWRPPPCGAVFLFSLSQFSFFPSIFFPFQFSS